MRHELCRIAERLGLEGDIPKRGTNAAVEAQQPSHMKASRCLPGLMNFQLSGAGSPTT